MKNYADNDKAHAKATRELIDLATSKPNKPNEVQTDELDRVLDILQEINNQGLRIDDQNATLSLKLERKN